MRSQSVNICFDLIKVKTLITSQFVTYLGNAGIALKTPLGSLHTEGDYPSNTLHTGFAMLVKAERAGLTELQPISVLTNIDKPFDVKNVPFPCSYSLRS